MAWTYYDYESQATDALRLARLRLFIDEINREVGPRLRLSTGGGADRDRDNRALVELLQGTLYPRLKELEASVGSVDDEDSRIKAGFTRGRPL